MSNSDTINQQQEREAKVSVMDSMCGMNKGSSASSSQMAPSTIWKLVVRVYENLMTADQEDVDALKDLVRSVACGIIDEKPPFQPLKLTSFVNRGEGSLMFGINTSGMGGADYYIGVHENGAVFGHDGMDENNVPLSSEC